MTRYITKFRVYRNGGRSLRAGYSGDYFAKVLGYDPSSLSRLENGKDKITKTFDHHVRSAIFAKIVNKNPDRDYDLHDKMLESPVKVPKQMEFKVKKSGWSFLLAEAQL